MVSPHPQFTHIDEKLKRRAEMNGQGPDPFIDPNGVQGVRGGRHEAPGSAPCRRIETRAALPAWRRRRFKPSYNQRSMALVKNGITCEALVLFTAACSDAPLQLTNIQIGRALNPDRSIASITTMFKPSETIYVSVQTNGAARGQSA